MIKVIPERQSLLCHSSLPALPSQSKPCHSQFGLIYGFDPGPPFSFIQNQPKSFFPVT